ncbi:hypothetical protein LTR95_009523 [Oleoguttula sp. CCFEE 5521]
MTRLAFILGVILGFTHDETTCNLLLKTAQTSRPAAHEISEELLFDSLLTLPQATRTNVHFYIMEIYLLWETYFIEHVLYAPIRAGMLDLFLRQSIPDDPADELLDELHHLNLSPHGPRRRILHRQRDSQINDPFDPCLCAIAEQLRQIKDYTRVIAGINRLSPGVDDPTSDSYPGMKLATKGMEKLHFSLVLMCSIPTLIYGTGGALLFEEPYRGIMTDRVGVRTGLTNVLRSLVALKYAVIACIAAIEGIEAEYPIFKPAVDDDEYISRKVSQWIRNAEEYQEAMNTDAIILALRMELAGVDGLLVKHATGTEVCMAYTGGCYFTAKNSSMM